MEVTINRYLELVALVTKYNEQYHEENNSEISDYEFDMLNKELKEIEKEYPEWVVPNSPTKKVGGINKREAGIKVEHNVPMLSIEDVFDKEDVINWVNKVHAAHSDCKFSVETKVDGLSLSLRYRNIPNTLKMELVLAETRGDGLIGEDVTVNALVIPDVPKIIELSYDYLELRGEVYMSHAAFERYNEKQEHYGKQLAANPRNLASGTMKLLDPELTKERGLSMFVFNVQDGPVGFMAYHTRSLDLLSSKGVKVVNHKLCSTLEEIIEEIDRIGESRGELDYDIDGAVVKLEQVAYRAEFTSGSKYSAGHIAYKYPSEEKETELIDVDLAVGRTGKITVTGVLKPVKLCGTTVQRVTLHNQDFINDKKVGIGGTYLIYKSGEIIPSIKEMVKSPDTIYKIPNECPVCGQPVVREEGMADIKCVNPSCPATLVSSISFFVGRDAMDIKALGEKYIQKLVDEGYLHNYADIYHLKEYRNELILKGLIGKEKNTDKIFKAIEDSKSNDPVKLLTGLGINNVGKATAKEIMRRYSSITDLSSATVEDLLTIQDIGEITAKSIVDFFLNSINKNIINDLILSGVNVGVYEDKIVSNKLNGKTFCITGKLSSMKREDAEALIEKNGGRISGVSKKLDYLIEGEDPGEKIYKARVYGIEILTENQFKAMLEE